MSVSIILREGESIQDAMARAKTTILKQRAQAQLDPVMSLSIEQHNSMFNQSTQQQ